MFVVCLQHYQLMQKFQKYLTVNPINLQVLEPATPPDSRISSHSHYI